MSKTYYDPDLAVDPHKWLALPEAERIRLVQSYHVASRTKVPSMKAHAAMHAAVENQVATGYGPSTRALARLQEEGLSRHEAVHAIAYVIAQFLYELNQEQSPEKQASFQARMNESIEKLHAAQWLSLQGGENDG
jgi:hypothetical protein